MSAADQKIKNPSRVMRLYKIRLIAPNKISLGIFPISFPPLPLYHPNQDFFGVAE
jgi:hypothetical protein